MDTKNFYEEKLDNALNKVNKIFKKDNPSLFADINSFETMEIMIDIQWGDWKHDHSYADYIMQKNGFTKINEVITEEDGSDTYSSTHFYIFKI